MDQQLLETKQAIQKFIKNITGDKQRSVFFEWHIIIVTKIVISIDACYTIISTDTQHERNRVNILIRVPRKGKIIYQSHIIEQRVHTLDVLIKEQLNPIVITHNCDTQIFVSERQLLELWQRHGSWMKTDTIFHPISERLQFVSTAGLAINGDGE